jgi:7-carboxy-7-deazaguanine synthase (Cx14CxxC type)
VSYKVKEIFYTLQGEGGQAGRAAVFCRFSGCNLWSGREEDRSKAICQFCDTDFWGMDGENGGKYETAQALAAKVAATWGDTKRGGKPLVVCTGGEPMLQLDEALCEAFHIEGFDIALETNGTIEIPFQSSIDWVCVSPKANSELKVLRGNELKLVYPQIGVMPQIFENLDFTHFFLQPMDSPKQAQNIQATLEYCLRNPKWRLSLQTHKILNIP